MAHVQVRCRSPEKLARLSTPVDRAQVSSCRRHQLGMSRRSWLWSAVFALACAPVLAGKAQPVEPSVRIVVGYGRSGDDAGALERRLGAEPTAAIPQPRVHVLAVRPERAGAVPAGLRSSPIVRYAERDSLG